MPKFLTIGYGDEDGYNKTPVAILDRAHQTDDRLRDSGAIVGIAGEPVQVRNPARKGVETRSGSFMRSDLPVAGFALIEANSIEQAVAQVAETPCAVAYGVVEVWPLER